MTHENMLELEQEVTVLFDEYVLLMQCHQSYALKLYGAVAEERPNQLPIPPLMTGLFESSASVRILGLLQSVMRNLTSGLDLDVSDLRQLANEVSRRSDWFFSETFLKDYLNSPTHPAG